MRIFIFVSLSFVSTALFSQQLERIKGKVVDENNVPIAYASIGILNTWIGTASNGQGYFSLDISTIPDTAYLQVSAISYKTFIKRIEKIGDKDSLIIKLAPHYTILKELEISSAGQDAKHIVQNALLNWHKNYPQEKYQLQGFYRELLRNDETYVYLTEAAFTLQDRGYHKEKDKKFRIDALRKSDDMRDMDSLDVYYDNFMRSNDLQAMFRRDFMDSQSRNWSLPFWSGFNQYFIENNSFFLDSMSYFNGVPVYCVSFYSEGRWANYYKDKIEYKQMIINAEDYAIIEYRTKTKPKEVTYTKDNVKGNASYLIDGEFFSSKMIKYTKYKGKYYPFLISAYSSVVGGDRQKSSRMAFEKLREEGENELDYDGVSYNGRKLNPDENNYYRHQQMVITSIKNAKDKDLYIRDKSMPYDPDFWKHFNTILVDEDLKSAKEQLESKRTLEEQFAANGQVDQ